MGALSLAALPNASAGWLHLRSLAALLSSSSTDILEVDALRALKGWAKYMEAANSQSLGIEKRPFLDAPDPSRIHRELSPLLKFLF